MSLNPPEALKESAVIVLLEETSDSLILTQRSPNLRDHPGEVCFPGGRWNEGDATLWMTALRELQEELGIDSARVRLVKELQRDQTHNGTIIHPWLASIATLEPYTANIDEVASVFKLPLIEVRAPANYKDIVVERYGWVVNTCQFIASNYFVWGATARIMRQLSVN